MKATTNHPPSWVFTPLVSSLLSLAAVGLSPTVQAQNSRVALEEVIVNARHVSESAQDVPIAITAFGEADLEVMAPRTLRDFDGTVPNLYLGMNAASASGGAIFIRGIGYAGTEKSQSPGVGTIIDGVQLGTNTGQLMDTFDIRRVEVNRGPQGVMFGKNTTGGTISIERIAPQFNDWGGAASLTYGDYEEKTFKGRVNIPLMDDQLALKLGYIKKERDGYWDNANEGCEECEGNIDYESFTAAMLWQPTDALDLKLTYDKIEDGSDLPPMDPFFNGPTPFQTLSDFDQRGVEYDLDAITLEMNWETRIGVFTSITGNRDSTDVVYTDFDGASLNDTASPIALFHTIRDQEFEQFSQELRLNGSFNEDWDFATGLYYYESEHSFEQNSTNIAQIPNPLAALDLPCAVIGLAPHPVVADVLCVTPQAYDQHVASEDVKSLGVFASVTWRPTDKMELGFGARYIDEEKDMSNAFFETTDPDNIVAGASLDEDDQWDDVIVKATASYRFNDQVMLYGSYGEGFLSGGYSIRSAVPEFATYKPETVDSYEMGLKMDLWDRRARLNLTAFYTEQTDKQFLSIIPPPPEVTFPTTHTVVNNRDETEIKGLEVEFLVAVTDNFTINFIGGIQDGEEKAFVIEGSRVGQPAGPFNAPDADIAFFPEWNWAITPTYTAQMGPGMFSASFTYKDQDEYIIGINSVDFGNIYEPGYSRLDARVAYEWTLASDDQLVFSVFGKNLTDEEYREHQLDIAPPDFGFQGWGAPATWSVEVQYRR